MLSLHILVLTFLLSKKRGGTGIYAEPPRPFTNEYFVLVWPGSPFYKAGVWRILHGGAGGGGLQQTQEREASREIHI